jgi:hypothetical protein
MYRVGPKQESEEQKKEIIREILLKYSGSVSGYWKLEQELRSSSLAQLQRIQAAYHHGAVDVSESQQRLADIEADRRRMHQEQALSNIFRVPINGKVAIDNQANRSIIAGWLQEDQGEQLSPAWFTKVLSEQPQLASQLTWQSADILDPKKRKQAEANQEAADRDTFNRFASENNFSQCESNYLLVKSVIGDGLSRHMLVSAVQSNALSLAPASPEELAQFRQDAIAAHNQKLLNMDIPSLRKLAREAGARGQAAPPLDETQRVRQAERADGVTYPVLPDEYRDGNGPEEVLDAKFIRKCSKETLKFLFKRFGSDQVEEALRTRRSDASPLW